MEVQDEIIIQLIQKTKIMGGKDDNKSKGKGDDKKCDPATAFDEDERKEKANNKAVKKCDKGKKVKKVNKKAKLGQTGNYILYVIIGLVILGVIFAVLKLLR